MLGTGLKLAYDVLGGPSTEEWKDLYGTYDEGYKDPELYKDVGRFSVNTIKDLVQFFPDIAADVAQSGISQLAQTELYNPFSEAGRKRELERSDSFFPHIPGVDLPGWDVLMEPEWKYSLDAAQSEKFGTPTLIKDNPFKNAVYNEEGEVLTYDNPSYKKIEKKADKELDDYYFGKNGIFTEKKADEISRLTDQAFSWEDWAAENPNTNPKKYDDEWSEEWEKQFANRYDKEMTDFFLKSVDGQLLGKYNIGGKKTSPLREFEMGFDYAWQGDPLLKYDPRRAETFTKAHGIADLVGGLGYKPAIKAVSRLAKKIKPSRPPRGSDEGIMRNAERLEDKRFDWAKRWMRDQGG